MTQSDTFSLFLSRRELYTLAAFLQIGIVWNLEDPYPGYLAEEIEERTSFIVDGLIKKSYVMRSSEDHILIDSMVAAILQTVGASKRILSLSLIPSEDIPLSSLIFQTQGLMVEQQPSSTDEIILTAVRDKDILKKRLLTFFNLPPIEAVNAPTFSIADGILSESRNLFQQNGHEACVSYLTSCSIPSDIIPMLIDSMLPKLVGSMVILEPKSPEKHNVDNVAFIYGDKYTWIIKPCQKDTNREYVWEPASSTQIRQSLLGIIDKFLV